MKTSNNADTYDMVINSDWQYYGSDEKLTLLDLANVTSWSHVRIPHTPKIEPKIVNNQWQGYSWYKKSINFNKEWSGKNVFVKFEGAMNEANVWLNGHLIRSHHGGYLPFTADITSRLIEGENTLLVGLNNFDNEITGPKPLATLDFNTYGGIYRDVILRVENPVFITDSVNSNLKAGGGIYVTFPKVSEDQSTVSIKTHVKNTGGKIGVSVKQSLFFKSELIGAQSTKVEFINTGESKTFSSVINMENAKLWSPRNPDLYQLVTEVVSNNKIVDSQKTRIGIRDFTITAEGVYINGNKTFLRGVNRHQEYPYVGYALSKEADYRDAVRIKSAGFDYVRLSHYPHSPAFMAAADELGLVLIDAILGWQYVSQDPKFINHVQQSCRDLIRRDRNHASVLAWECSLNESWMPDSLIDSFTKIVKEELPGQTAYSAGWQEYGYDIYLQARQHRLEHYKPPLKPYIVSEYGDWEYYAMNAGLNQDSWDGLLQEERTSRQLLASGEARLLQQSTNIQEAHNDNFNTVAVADGYWVMFDYNRGYADDLESSGIMSIDRLSKFSYYFFQSQRDADWDSDIYESGAMVHIASYWDESSSLDVRVFSNAEEVELSLDGISLGRQKPSVSSIMSNLRHPPFVFSLKAFKAGELTATAYINNKVVAQHSVASPKKISGISLSSDINLGNASTSIGDTIFVYATLINDKGQIVPKSGVDVTFDKIKGAKLLSPAMIKTEAGIASALIRVTSINMKPVISASAPSLKLSDSLYIVGKREHEL